MRNKPVVHDPSTLEKTRARKYQWYKVCIAAEDRSAARQ